MDNPTALQGQNTQPGERAPAGTAKWNPTERVRALSYQFVQWPSETGTPDEASFAGKLVDLLREIPYFRAHPDHIAAIDSHGAPMVRSVVALVRGAGARALAFAGHYDTVSIANYRDLAAISRDPDALTKALIDDLSGRPLTDSEASALADLRSGDFIPGRGMLDMKSGIAAGVAVLEKFADTEDREGNLLLFVTPDEERGSRGMRSLREALPGLMRRWELDIVAGINLDATSDLGDGAEGRVIYRGSIGKLLPFAFVVGRPSHASYPFEGISANLIAAEILRTVEGNPELCDRGEGEVSPPPICLEARDLREGYEVTTPEQAWLAFNWLSHSRSPEEVFDLIVAIVDEAQSRAIAQFGDRAERYAELTAAPTGQTRHAGKVLTVAQLRQEGLRVSGADGIARLDALAASLADRDNPLLITRRLVEQMVADAQITGPTVIVGFGSLHYPHVHLDQLRQLDRELSQALERARQSVEVSEGMTIKYREYFNGISDMSFFGTRLGEVEANVVVDNTPAHQFVDVVSPAALVYPVVNVGPWGREFHQRLERVHAPFAFRTLPVLLMTVVDELFSRKPQD